MFSFNNAQAQGFSAAALTGRRATAAAGFSGTPNRHQAAGFAFPRLDRQVSGFAPVPQRRLASLQRDLSASVRQALNLALSPLAQALRGAFGTTFGSTLGAVRHGPPSQSMASALAWGRSLPWRRIGQGSALVAASGVAFASALVTHGYVTHNPEWVRERLAQRLGSPLYDREGELLGALYTPAVAADGRPVDHQALGYVHASQPVPPLFTALLLDLEHKQHFNGWRNWCGTDPLAKVAGLFSGGSRGASGFAEQAAKELALPDEHRSGNLLVAVLQKVEGLGKACAVHRALGGPQGVLDTYEELAPYSKIGGTTRGAETASRVTFGVPLAQATPAQLAVLAAAVQRNFAQVAPAAFAPGCTALVAMKPAEAKAQDASTVEARSQCATLARARVALKHVLLPGPMLDQALAEIAALERTGIQPTDVFTPLPARKLVNLSLRAQTLMGPALVQDVARAADAQELPPGSALTLSFSGHEQKDFSVRLAAAFDAVDASSAGREQLCVSLSPRSGPRRCRIPAPGFGRAEVLLARARVDDGGVTRLYHSPGSSPDAQRQTGSIAKMVIAAAALARGYTPDTPVCPRSASDGGRPLRRDSRVAPNGFANCEGHRISLREAFATSDSLAFYDMARQFGPQALLLAAQALGLPQSDDLTRRPAFALAFGTLLATPAQMLALGQAVFGLAYGIDVTAEAPQLLSATATAPPQAFRQLGALLPAVAQRGHLRTLVEAPVSDNRGTLHALQRSTAAVAGKSGTTSSPYRPQPGQRPYQQAKLSLTYQASDGTVALTVIAGGAPHPLAQAAMPVEVLNPVRVALLR